MLYIPFYSIITPHYSVILYRRVSDLYGGRRACVIATFMGKKRLHKQILLLHLWHTSMKKTPTENSEGVMHENNPVILSLNAYYLFYHSLYTSVRVLCLRLLGLKIFLMPSLNHCIVLYCTQVYCVRYCGCSLSTWMRFQSPSSSFSSHSWDAWWAARTTSSPLLWPLTWPTIHRSKATTRSLRFDLIDVNAVNAVLPVIACTIPTYHYTCISLHLYITIHLYEYSLI